MRQAGRCLPAYRALRKKYSFKEVAETPELCAEVTLMPLQELEVDAAIIFADLMTPVACLGRPYEIVEGTGPVVGDPVRTMADVEQLDRLPSAEVLPQLFEAMRMIAKELDGEVPMIGFAGAPFTIASYLVEGRPNLELPNTRKLMETDPRTWHALMDALSNVLVDYIGQQVEAGAQAIQLFDSWAGRLTPDQYREFALPHSARILAETATAGVPRIHFGTNTADLLTMMAAPDPEVVGVDWRIPLDQAWDRIGRGRAIQGNLDPHLLLESKQQVVSGALDVLRRAGGRPGHIFNLGHGVLPDSPLDNLKALVDTVHEYQLP